MRGLLCGGRLQSTIYNREGCRVDDGIDVCLKMGSCSRPHASRHTRKVLYTFRTLYSTSNKHETQRTPAGGSNPFV